METVRDDDDTATQATPETLAPPRLEWIGSLDARLGAPTMIGETPKGTRLILPVVEGIFDGPRLSGRIVSLSGDWLLVRTDGVGEVDVRGVIQTTEDALVYVTYRGYLTNIPAWLPRWSQGEEVSPEEYSFVTTPVFETGAPAYDWLQRTVFIAMGTLTPGGVRYEVFSVG